MKVYTHSFRVHVLVDLLYFLLLPKVLRACFWRQAEDWHACCEHHHFIFKHSSWKQLDTLIKTHWPRRITVIYGRSGRAGHGN